MKLCACVYSLTRAFKSSHLWACRTCQGLSHEHEGTHASPTSRPCKNSMPAPCFGMAHFEGKCAVRCIPHVCWPNGAAMSKLLALMLHARARSSRCPFRECTDSTSWWSTSAASTPLDAVSYVRRLLCGGTCLGLGCEHHGQAGLIALAHHSLCLSC